MPPHKRVRCKIDELHEEERLARMCQEGKRPVAVLHERVCQKDAEGNGPLSEQQHKEQVRP